jgi:hypothetical protein
MIGWLMNVKQLLEWKPAGETEVLGEIPHSDNVCIANRTWLDLGLNPGWNRGKPATNRLIYDKVVSSSDQ